MSDVDEQPEHLDDDVEDHAHQACYVFRPFATDDFDGRPKKKRKVKHTPQNESTSFPLLEHGGESEAQSKQRLQCLRKIWAEKQQQIEQLISENDTAVLSEIIDFATSVDPANTNGRLCAGLVVTGSDSSIQNRLIKQWNQARSSQPSEVLIQLTTSLCPSLQVALRNIVKSVLTECVGNDGYTSFLAKHKRLIPMNFDLELLQIFARERGIQRIVISLLDVETFDTGILSQLLVSLSSWSQRIPFIALLGIATNVELFASRLPKSTVEHLDTTIFSLASANDVLYQIFTTFQCGLGSEIILGPSTLAALYELSQSQSTTAESFVNTIKLAVMSHFFANSISVLAGGNSTRTQDSMSICAAVRHTDSFRDHCEILLNQGKAGRSMVRDLLQDNVKLLSTLHTSISEGQHALRAAMQTVAGLRNIRKHLGLESKSPFLFDIELYSRLDNMRSSKLVQEILDHLRNASSSKLLAILESLEPTTMSNFALDTPLQKLRAFQQSHGSDSIRAIQEDPHAAAASAIGQFNPTKSPTKANATPVQKQYTTLLVSIVSQIKGTIQSTSCTFEPFMHEAFVINNRHVLVSTIVPRPRHVLERALSRPADYLNCDCDTDHQRTNGTTREDTNQQHQHHHHHQPPPISILYHLLQEAGTIINVRDLFEAFQSRLNPSMSSSDGVNDNFATGTHDANTSDDEDDMNDAEENNNNNIDPDHMVSSTAVAINETKHQRIALCLFYQSLSELKMLGMVKSSTSTMIKKRALAFEGGAAAVGNGRGKKAYAEIDFIAKTSWAGL